MWHGKETVPRETDAAVSSFSLPTFYSSSLAIEGEKEFISLIPLKDLRTPNGVQRRGNGLDIQTCIDMRGFYLSRGGRDR